MLRSTSHSTAKAIHNWGALPPYVTLAVHHEPILQEHLAFNKLNCLWHHIWPRPHPPHWWREICRWKYCKNLENFFIDVGFLLLLLQVVSKSPLSFIVTIKLKGDLETTCRMGDKRAYVTLILKMSHFRNKSWSLDDEVNWGEKCWLHVHSVEHLRISY